MSLPPGTRLGAYEVLAQIGAGGMGEVYKARDTRLDRTVAIKVLASHVASHPDLRQRFEREARAVAALNHPHICTLHDIGEAPNPEFAFLNARGAPPPLAGAPRLEDSRVAPAAGASPNPETIQFLVMEYLDGDTLAARLEKGPLPLDQALPYAVEIADALDKAHRQGITHRDLKPGNVMLTKSGTKLLDFGLAKLRPVTTGVVTGMSAAPTIGSPFGPAQGGPLTGQGTILGTLHYMAPEQVEGKEADARTDLFAFGAVVYEMATGKKAFEGKSQASVIGAIMSSDPPPMVSLQPLTPPLLDHIVKRCLAKDPDERWQAAGDVMRELKWIADGAGAPGTVIIGPRARRRDRVAWWIAGLAVLAVAALAVPTVLYVGRAAPEPLPTRFEIQTPPTSDPASFALSLDGRQLAFVATSEGAQRLWVRPLDQVTAQTLAGTEGASHPFWAPDGRAIGFFAGGKLKRVDLAGGAPQVLADAPADRGGTWSRDGIIVFAPVTFGPLMRVAATGGTPLAVTRLETGQGSHRWPQFLPDGNRFLFFMGLAGGSATQGVYVGALAGGEPRRVLEAETAAAYAPPGALLLVRQGVLVALGFDATRGVVTGGPIPVAQAVGLDPGVARGTFAVSEAGALAHRASGAERRQLVWVDRAGTVRGTVGPPDENALGNPELAPDGRRVAVQRAVQGNVDVWLLEVGRGVPRRFTFDAGTDGDPMWSPDGNRIAFRSTRTSSAVMDLFEKPASGTADEQSLLVTAEPKTPLAWSPDGRLLLYVTQDPKTGADLWALPVTGERPSTGSASSRSRGEPAGPPPGRADLSSSKLEGRKAFPVVQTPFDETAGQFSPDGRWIAYESNESGPVEVYAQPFPGQGGKWQVSTAGGNQPRWRPDGKELFYVAPDGRLMAVPIAVAVDKQTLQTGAPVPLFATRLASGSGITGVARKPQYAVAPDGRFLMNVAVEAATASPITIVLNWDAALKK